MTSTENIRTVKHFVLLCLLETNINIKGVQYYFFSAIFSRISVDTKKKCSIYYTTF